MTPAGMRMIVELLVGLAAIWILVPSIAAALGLSRLRNEVFEEPSRAEPRGDDPDYERRFRQFAALGFRPLGMTYESGWFISPLKWHWKSLQGERWMVSPDRMLFATFHRLIREEPVRFGVITLNDRGGLMRTTCPGAGVSADPHSDCARFEVRNVEPAALVELHRKNVEKFCRDRGLASKSATLRGAAEADVAFTRSKLKARRSGSAAGILFALAAALVLPRLSHLLSHAHGVALPAVPHPVQAGQRHLPLTRFLLVLCGPVYLLIMFLVVLPNRRRRRILRSHTEDMRGD